MEHGQNINELDQFILHMRNYFLSFGKQFCWQFNNCLTKKWRVIVLKEVIREADEFVLGVLCHRRRKRRRNEIKNTSLLVKRHDKAGNDKEDTETWKLQNEKK
jgi:hypothetical protein